MRKKLTNLTVRANKTQDMHKRLDRYTTLLNTPEITYYLNPNLLLTQQI